MRLRKLLVRLVLPAVIAVGGIGLTSGTAHAGLTNCNIYSGYRTLYFNDWMSNLDSLLSAYQAGDYDAALYWNDQAEYNHGMYMYYDGRVNACNMREP